MVYKQTNIIVTGDPIIDHWSYGSRDSETKRWIPTNTLSTPGGAANTAWNATLIGRGKTNTYPSFCKNHPALIRLINKDNNQLDTEFWNYTGEPTKLCRLPGNLLTGSWAPNHQYALLISEYNKGSCNRPTRRQLPPFEFAVVDSRYRTLDMSWIKTAKTKIWHATGNEYDEEWAQNFDYTLWTNGSKPVIVIPTNPYRNSNGYQMECSVPNTPVVDTIGAGDTFTAAVGVYLAQWLMKHPQAKYPQIIDMVAATNFAIWCCQDVITRQHTAICSRTLKEYLGE